MDHSTPNNFIPPAGVSREKKSRSAWDRKLRRLAILLYALCAGASPISQAGPVTLR
jgi:hypothetical protein